MAMNARKIVGWTNLLLAAVVAFAIWMAATLLFNLPQMRFIWDWSPQARFTVEPATEQLLADIGKQDKKVEFYTLFLPYDPRQARSEDERRAIAITQRLQQLTRDLLFQYELIGGDAVEVRHFDPRYDISEIKEVVKLVDDRRFDSVIVKLGQRTRTLSLQADLAVFEGSLGRNPGGSPQRQSAVRLLKDFKGEEALSTAVKRLMVEGTPKLYIWTPLTGAMLGDPFRGSFSHMLSALKDDGFDIKVWNDRGTLPDDADALAILSPRSVKADDADLLLEFCRRGGRVFANSHFWLEPASWNRPLTELGKRFGFELGVDLVCHPVGDLRQPNRLRFGTAQCQNLHPTFNPRHPITSPLVSRAQELTFKAGRAIRMTKAAPSAMRREWIARTGPYAWIAGRLPTGQIDYAPPQGNDQFTTRTFGLAVEVDPAEEGDRAGRFVILSAAGLENDGFSINGDFGLNVFNWLVERDALLSIRGRMYVSRRLELTPQQVDNMWWLLAIGVPGGLLLLGLLVFWRRSRV